MAKKKEESSEDADDALGLKVPTEEEEEPSPPSTKAETHSFSVTSSLEDKVKDLCGVEGLEVFDQIAKGSGKTLEDIVKVELVEDGGKPIHIKDIEIFSGKNRTPVSMKVYDKDDEEVKTLPFLDYGNDGYSIDGVLQDTLYDDYINTQMMGKIIANTFKSFTEVQTEEVRGKKHQKYLQTMRQTMTNLSEVFGFDDPAHLEVFIAAWLMRDSTCRLSGIPGTGKTTVINTAATLLGNSYGFHSSERLVAPSGRTYTLEEIYTKPYSPDSFPKGMTYDVNYGNIAYESRFLNWEAWRFRDWSNPEDGYKASGAYLYDFDFLVQGRGNEPLTPDTFCKLLTNCWVKPIPFEGFNLPNPESIDPEEAGWQDKLIEQVDETEMTTKAMPIQVVDEKGSLLEVFTPPTVTIADAAGTKWDFRIDRQFYPELNPAIYRQYLSVGNVEDYIVKSYGLYTDAGRSEGYGLRKYLSANFYDDRTYGVNRNLKAIEDEMLREIGVAKIDYEKRADEVLYGLEIRRSSEQDKLRRGVLVSTYEFEPVPRPIVTQPIKFFNEANRSQSGVEDAILGLIAEKTVEYRGKTFPSPDFVAWMDTNPHQKGNDLAFVDRIDMEILFKSVSLGARYGQLKGVFGSEGGGGQPQQRLLLRMIAGETDTIKPMRFYQLRHIWDFVNSMRFRPPGTTELSSSYDGLRDISLISVLFTQRFQSRPTEVNVGGQPREMVLGSDMYESPLLDFSTTTNTTEEGGTNLPVNTDWQSQTPFLFERVLGFRFSNSMVKLSSAFAFLRGKSYVTREEILDSIPYVTAHRMGRARGPKSDLMGIPKDVNWVNEQELIREAIVNGYILRRVDMGMGRDQPSMLDSWDLYYKRCVDALKSVPSLIWYESQILIPLKEALSAGGAALNMTPVHWHIATMVVENERKGVTNYRNYTKPNCTDYPEQYNYYLGRIFDKPNQESSKVCLGNYFQLRGTIAKEPNLFSDDKEALLNLVDSEMTILAGHEGGSESAIPLNSSAISKGNAVLARFTETSYAQNPREFTWRTYGDGVGVYGLLIGASARGGTTNVNLGSPDNNLAFAPSFANQDFILSARMEIKEKREPVPPTATEEEAEKIRATFTAGSINRDKFTTALEKIQTDLQNDVKEGWLLKGVQEDSYGVAVTFKEFMEYVQIIVEEYPSQKEATGGREVIIDAKTGLGISDMLNGLMGCFRLEHAPNAPTGLAPDIKGDDHLRLWVRIFEINHVTGVRGGVTGGTKDFVTLALTMGITSNLAIKNKYMDVVPSAEDSDEAKTYVRLNYTNVEDYKRTGSGPTKRLKDAGNITKEDKLYYSLMFGDALNI